MRKKPWEIAPQLGPRNSGNHAGDNPTRSWAFIPQGLRKKAKLFSDFRNQMPQGPLKPCKSSSRAAFKNTNSTETEGQEEANRMRCNIFKMSVLAKLIYKFKTIPIKIPAAGFCKNGQIPYANFNMKMQGTLGGQNNLVKRRTKLRTHISQFQKLL